MTALIDGDIIVYRCAASLKKTRYNVYSAEGELLISVIGKKNLDKEMKELADPESLEVEILDEYDPVEFGFSSVRRSIDAILETTGQPNWLLFVTGDTNFRTDIATIAGYKADRPPRPKFYKEIKDYLWSLGVIVSDGCEADDMLGIYAMANPEDVICSIDKDLDMIPGNHFDFVKSISYEVTEEEALIAFYRQILTGDKVDNIIGIHGLGPVKAGNLIHEGMSEEEMFVTCLEQYEKDYKKDLKDAHATDVDAITANLAWKHVVENGKLLWIWRKPQDIWNTPISMDRALDMLNSRKMMNASNQNKATIRKPRVARTEVQDSGVQGV